MAYSGRKVAGALVFLGAVQFVVGLIVAEAVHPGYSVSGNYISDLGVGPAALIFNSSVFLLGLMVVVGAYYLQRAFRKPVVVALFVITGVGAMGVGVFPETAGPIHGVMSLVTFLFAGLSAIAAYTLEESPLSYFSVLMGVAALIALALYVTGNYWGLGHGGMERMIAYPVLLWAIGFGGYLMAHPPTPPS